MVRKTFTAEDNQLDALLLWVDEELNKVEVSIKLATQIKICIEEIFVNIAHYAYSDKNGDVVIDIMYDEKENSMSFIFEDEGIPYNPLEKQDPDITLSAEDREIGGLGIFICKKTMDVISYKYEDNKNILIMTKNL